MAQARKSRGAGAGPAPANSRARRTAWDVRRRTAGVLSALLLGVVTLVSPAPASALGALGTAGAGGAAAAPVQRTPAQQADRPTRSERSRDLRGQSPRAAQTAASAPMRAVATGPWTPERTTRQHSQVPDTGALPVVPTALPVPRAVVACGTPTGVTAPTSDPPGLPDVRGPPSGISRPHCPVPAPPHRPR